MTFQAWITQAFGERGITRAADKLGYPFKTVYAWVKLERFPRAEAQQAIEKESGGQVDFIQWRNDYVAHKNKKQEKTA